MRILINPNSLEKLIRGESHCSVFYSLGFQFKLILYYSDSKECINGHIAWEENPVFISFRLSRRDVQVFQNGSNKRCQCLLENFSNKIIENSKFSFAAFELEFMLKEFYNIIQYLEPFLRVSHVDTIISSVDD
jgi:hypothetical protein